jgi:hypothetical protein
LASKKNFKNPGKPGEYKKVIFPHEQFRMARRISICLTLIFGAIAFIIGPELSLIFTILCIMSLFSTVIVAVNMYF